MEIEGCVGLTRVRNEALILGETLDHFAALCDMGIVVVDDSSTDDTAAIAEAHRAVVTVVRNEVWHTQRPAEEWRLRQLALDEGRRLSPEWFLAFDADERLDFSDALVDDDVDAVAFRLFDAYITAEDASVIGTNRRWFGPEYRDIVMLFRNESHMSYWLPDQRVVAGVRHPILGGYARHYGKAVSVEEHEQTCDYYASNFPEPYRTKWLERKGGAVHSESDFGRPLYEWPEVIEHGIELHDASSPHAAPRAITESMLIARGSEYLCTRCHAPLVSIQDAFGEWSLSCSANICDDWRALSR